MEYIRFYVLRRRGALNEEGRRVHPAGRVSRTVHLQTSHRRLLEQEPDIDTEGAAHLHVHSVSNPSV